MTAADGNPAFTRKKRLLALACRCCPLCIAARLAPRSAFARKLRAMEKDCPACRAYREVYARPSAAECGRKS